MIGDAGADGCAAEGIDFRGILYPGIMITDTAPFRYPHYHSSTDTPDKLDYDRFALVVSGMEKTIAELAK